MKKSKVIRKVGGILVIDGVKMRSPATIESDKPGRIKALYIPKEKVS
jgi:uncharacterized protein YlxW (UPF0749 family)